MNWKHFSYSSKLCKLHCGLDDKSHRYSSLKYSFIWSDENTQWGFLFRSPVGFLNNRFVMNWKTLWVIPPCDSSQNWKIVNSILRKALTWESVSTILKPNQQFGKNGRTSSCKILIEIKIVQGVQRYEWHVTLWPSKNENFTCLTLLFIPTFEHGKKITQSGIHKRFQRQFSERWSISIIKRKATCSNDTRQKNSSTVGFFNLHLWIDFSNHHDLGHLPFEREVIATT